MDLRNNLKIGNGIYTATDISKILRIPRHKVSRWIARYWDGKFGEPYDEQYSWKVGKTKEVGFHTLVEIYVLIQLGDAGVNTRKVLKAHLTLSELFDTPFPFADKRILDSLKTDGNRIYFDTEHGIVSLDGKMQLQIDFIALFFKRLDFDHELLATRLFPLGKNRHIIVDPNRQFGHPVIGNTNIHPEAIYNLYKAGESVGFISHLYELKEKEVQDAIDYCQAA